MEKAEILQALETLNAIWKICSMKPTTIEQTKRAMIEQGKQRCVPFMDFVDEFRRTRDVEAMARPWPLDHPRYDALLASTLEYLCDEAGVEPPAWSWEIPACGDP
jgi:hypothetical protein